MKTKEEVINEIKVFLRDVIKEVLTISLAVLIVLTAITLLRIIILLVSIN
jgi:hypothetical protein